MSTYVAYGGKDVTITTETEARIATGSVNQAGWTPTTDFGDSTRYHPVALKRGRINGLALRTVGGKQRSPIRHPARTRNTCPDDD